MDLFSQDNNNTTSFSAEAPLAVRMRPRNLDEFFGQEHIVGQGRLLRRAICADRLTSMIFYGPPGTGKTTLAEIIAKTTESHCERLNAVTAGVADIRRVIDEARERTKFYNRKTLLFIDEIHRFNKSQQDALLPAVEEGTVLLVGATTENPLYEVNAPLVSRSMIFRLNPLSSEEITKIIKCALEDHDRGLADYRVKLTEEAEAHLVGVADGDARMVLNALELAAMTTEPDSETNQRLITPEIIKDCVQQRPITYDKKGQAHYDTISAFIKSMRGSDPDAAIYYMARMLSAGEDPKFIARRMIVHAAEDVGNADPQALVVAVAAAQALEMIGLPEARLCMAEAAIYIATAPKSNASHNAICEAMDDIQKMPNNLVPQHLRDTSHSASVKVFGDGVGYKYPHEYPDAYVEQQYLPDNMLGKQYYHPTDRGCEKEISEYLQKVKQQTSESKDE